MAFAYATFIAALREFDAAAEPRPARRRVWYRLAAGIGAPRMLFRRCARQQYPRRPPPPAASPPPAARAPGAATSILKAAPAARFMPDLLSYARQSARAQERDVHF